MTLHAQFRQELDTLGTGAAIAVTVSEHPRHLACDIAERNSLAVSFDSLRLSTDELAAAEVIDLERISQTLAAKLTYLMEPITPIEADADACIVQMRSNPPQKDDVGRTYFELLVRRGGELALFRYRKEPGKAREKISATVTREVLIRLVEDFEDALA